MTDSPAFSTPALALIKYGPPATEAVATEPSDVTVGSVEKTSAALGNVNAPLTTDGMLTDTAPSVGIQYCGVGWAMAHPVLQSQLYRYYGDRRIVEEQYAVSKRWLELVRAQNEHERTRRDLEQRSLTTTTDASL